MKYGSVCSGIEAATVAWHPLGWTPALFSEIEPFPCRLLKHHYPAVPNLGDMLKLRFNEVYQKSAIDLLVGGTPCQSFSIAGLRGGLGDSRGNLALEFCRILADKRPRFFLWENVPGVFSSSGGRDFATILRGFREFGYSCAWRVLDAQYWGVPQQRRRVFVVGYLGDDWRPPAAVLFEPEGMRRNPEKGRKEGKETAGTLDARLKGGGFPGSDGAMNGHIVSTLDANYGRLQGASGQDANHGHSLLVAFGGNNTAGSIDKSTACNGHKSASGRMYFESETFIVTPINTQVASRGEKMGEGTGMGIGDPGDPAYTLQKAHSYAIFHHQQSASGSMNPIALSPTLQKGKNPAVFDLTQVTSALNGSNPKEGDPSHPLTKGGQPPLLIPTVRRLTPLECERLQGFPDGYTAIPGAKDSPRYSAIGNSMAVPVMAWIGSRIDIIDKIFTKP